MKPVNQTRVNSTNGDCYAACLASLLELPIEDMPDFFATGNAYTARTAWLLAKGWQESYFALGSYPPPVGLAILAVSSATFPGCHHAVVWDGREGTGGCIVHNPNHQDGRGVDIPNEDWLGFYLLAPIDPALATLRENRTVGKS